MRMNTIFGDMTLRGLMLLICMFSINELSIGQNYIPNSGFESLDNPPGTNANLPESYAGYYLTDGTIFSPIGMDLRDWYARYDIGIYQGAVGGIQYIVDEDSDDFVCGDNPGMSDGNYVVLQDCIDEGLNLFGVGILQAPIDDDLQLSEGEKFVISYNFRLTRNATEYIGQSNSPGASHDVFIAEDPDPSYVNDVYRYEISDPWERLDEIYENYGNSWYREHVAFERHSDIDPEFLTLAAVTGATAFDNVRLRKCSSFQPSIDPRLWISAYTLDMDPIVKLDLSSVTDGLVNHYDVVEVDEHGVPVTGGDLGYRLHKYWKVKNADVVTLNGTSDREAFHLRCGRYYRVGIYLYNACTYSNSTIVHRYIYLPCVGEPAPGDMSMDLTVDECIISFCDDGSYSYQPGSINAAVSGGTWPFEYYFNDEGPIGGPGPNRSFSFPQPGLYSVRVVDANGLEVEEQLEIVTCLPDFDNDCLVGDGDKEKDNTRAKSADGLIDYRIGPNPFDEDFTIAINNVTDETIRYVIHDVRGAMMDRGTIDHQIHKVVKTSDWHAGVYFIHVYSGDQRLTKKIIKL